MSTEIDPNLQRLIALRNWQAVEVARKAGPSATATAGEAISNPDSEIRFIALNCVLAAGGPEASRHLLKALTDDDEQIRATAAKALLDHPPKGLEAEAVAIWQRQPDPTVRYYLALSLGLTGDLSRLTLKGYLTSLPPDQPASTRDSLIGALVRQKDVDGKRAMKGILLEARGNRVAQVLEVFRYVDDAAHLKMLRPLLDRQEDAVDLSNHAIEFKRRACDLAVDEVARLAPGKLSFPRDTAKRYTPMEVSEAAKLLDGLPEAADY